MIKDIKTRYKILGGIGIAAIIALLIAIPAVGRSSKHNDVAVNDTEITSDALQKGSDIDSHQYPTSSADLESQSSEELTTANTLENSSEPAGETVDTTNVASNTVESEQGNQNVDTSNNTVVDNSNAPENVADNDTGVDDSSSSDSGDTVDVADNSDWNTKIETVDRNVERGNMEGYVVHEGDQARHDVGDVGTVKDIYDQLIMDGYSDEEAREILRAKGYHI
ncbi:MAG: hypothetical protein UH654_00435 [Lachnospiraceae bacterium]|nr:hypothetical protein [Lachnospiraceae bacterium]